MSRDRAQRSWEPPEVAALAALLLLTACSDPATAPPSLGYAAEPAHVWAGGEVAVTVTNGTFRTGDVVLLGTDTLAAVSGDPASVAFRIPTDVNGPISLTVFRNGTSLGEAAVEAYGLEALRDYPGHMDDMISPVPVPSGVSVAARTYEAGDCRGASGGDFVWIYPSTGMHRSFTGTSCESDLYRVGVDPVTGDLYPEYRQGTPEECDGGQCELVHRTRIVGGELVDLGWVRRPCNRWGCEPLAGDIWIMPDAALTCRVVSTPTGDTCEWISVGFNDDPQGVERLWSRDVGLSLGPPIAFRMSTGEELYRLPGFSLSAAPDEARGLFYLGTVSSGIVVVRGEDGTTERTHPVNGVSFLAYDPTRDLLFVLRYDTRTLDARDPVSFELRGQVAVPDEIVSWTYARVLVDEFTQRLYLVFGAVTVGDPELDDLRPASGTPVVAVRLPPA